MHFINITFLKYNVKTFLSRPTCHVSIPHQWAALVPVHQTLRKAELTKLANLAIPLFGQDFPSFWLASVSMHCQLSPTIHPSNCAKY